MSTPESSVPREAKVVSLILRSLGIEECEPKVILQILEFAYKYTTDVLIDAQAFMRVLQQKANHR
jgi:transcription initiation factor TFIID subunit 9B